MSRSTNFNRIPGAAIWVRRLMIGALVLGGCSGAPGNGGNDNGQNANDNGQNANENTNDNGQANDNDNDNGTVAGLPALFVVNNNISVTSYQNADELDGEVPPDTELNLGAATSLFQPRSVVVTSEDILLLSRQNGGIVGYDSALAVTGDDPADLVVEGPNSELDSPISFAYDPVNDRLFVGNASANAGILVFDQVSESAEGRGGVNFLFNGDVAPDRTFGPPDRAPFGDSPSPMTVDALTLDSDGALYVSDTSGLNVNSSRILVFESAGSAQGEVQPRQTITSQDWRGIQDMEVDANDVLYIVDDSASVFMLFDAFAQDNEVIPSATLTVGLPLVSLQGIVVASDGAIYVADTSNHAVYVYNNARMLNDVLDPDRILEGTQTGLFSPRQMFLLE